MISDESYCSPWDLRIQEERFQRTYSIRPLLPPPPPPLPPGGFIQSCHCNISKVSTEKRVQRRQSIHGQTRQRNSSLPKLPQNISSSCQFLDDSTHIPIDRYLWYHSSISRRQAELILESRSSGSFLVRQSESGNHNDYSLSIQTTHGCMHMRINYSNDFYILGECSQPFSSVSSIIKYFTQMPVPIRGATHIKLGAPVLRWQIRSSSLSNEELL